MNELLHSLPLVIAAQALGVGVALATDAWSWKRRRDEKTVFAINLMSLVMLPISSLLLFVFLDFVLYLFPFIVVVVIRGAIFFWLLLVTWVQKRQFALSLRAAFFSALFQMVCVCWVLTGALWLLVAFPALIFADGWFAPMYLISLALSSALLALFRPTISAMANALRQSLKKNRPLR